MHLNWLIANGFLSTDDLFEKLILRKIAKRKKKQRQNSSNSNNSNNNNAGTLSPLMPHPDVLQNILEFLITTEDDDNDGYNPLCLRYFLNVLPLLRASPVVHSTLRCHPSFVRLQLISKGDHSERWSWDQELIDHRREVIEEHQQAEQRRVEREQQKRLAVKPQRLEGILDQEMPRPSKFPRLTTGLFTRGIARCAPAGNGLSMRRNCPSVPTGQWEGHCSSVPLAPWEDDEWLDDDRCLN